jgi:RNA polymerase sigma-70 factor (ECF subfamily)
MTNKETFAASVAEHLPYLTRYVRSLIRFDPDVEDIVQQTVLKALVHADQFRFQSTLKTWLTSIARNETRQMLRVRLWARTAPLTGDLERESSYSRILRTPSCYYGEKQRAEIVRRAVSRLPKPYGSIVELCDLQGFSLAEAASKLSLSLAAAKSRRRRAREKMLPLVEQLKD